MSSGRRYAAKLLTKNEARRIASNKQQINKRYLFASGRKMRRGCRAAKESTDSMAAAWLRLAEITETFNETLVIEKQHTKPIA
jgi:hypothetical protein